ncbi:MAG: hypothetical protein JW779_01220 [Candidatus Thorarchaeota archaeon]|nr:hypothetical protein [Candidatus Thorarchaeota archaeon]
MQLESLLSPDVWLMAFLSGFVPLAFILLVIYKACTARATTGGYARTLPRPVDGSGPISAAQGAAMSYFPNDTCTSTGAFPISGMGPSGKGGYGFRPHNKDE